MSGGYPAVVLRALGSRARYGIWTGKDGPHDSWPLLLLDGVLQRGYGRPGKVVQVIGPEPSPKEAYDLLAKHERVRGYDSQGEWLRERFPDSFATVTEVEQALIPVAEA